MPATIHPDDFKFLSDFVMREAAIVLETGKEYLAITRLEPVARKEDFPDVGALIKELRMHPMGPLRQKIVDAMTTNETLFFRDAHPFEAFAKNIVPELMKARAAARTLDIWCAAASTGQEPYSLAMLLRESFPELATWRVNILGTDISDGALARAKAGKYTQMEVGRGLPARYMVKYFTRVGTEWQISQDIRNMVSYRNMNLASPWMGMGPFDVVFIRNVLIYFNQATKKDIVNRAAKTLRPDGVLMLGSTESLLGMETEVTRDTFDKTTFYRPKTAVGAGVRN